ncbi:MAG: metal-dependent hydrolase [Proteobacteria bacterium]|nr:metal-dependent hydrolase [Pseudomonadota bacterium]
MFIGHFGAGLAAKRIAPRPSLGTLFLGSQFIDLLWPVLLILGLERVEIDPGNTAFTPLNFTEYPFTHSFLAVLGWSLVVGGIYYAIRKHIRSAIVVGGLVMSHWVLDLLTHRPDLPLVPWSDTKVGMGLWNSIPLTVLVEGSLFIFGAYVYFKTTKALNGKGTFGLWGLLAFLVVMYALNLFGPPPPSVEPIGYAGLLQWLLVAWAYWIDRNRSTAPQFSTSL